MLKSSNKGRQLVGAMELVEAKAVEGVEEAEVEEEVSTHSRGLPWTNNINWTR